MVSTAYAVRAQDADVDSNLVERSYGDYKIIRQRRAPGLAAFFPHKHTLGEDGIDFVSQTFEEGYLVKSGLVYCIPLAALSTFFYGVCLGWFLVDGKLVEAIISLDDDEGFDESPIRIGNFLSGTGAIAFKPQVLSDGVVETEEVIRVGKQSASRVYKKKARLTRRIDPKAAQTLVVASYPHIVCGHAHMKGENGERLCSHWSDKKTVA